MLALWYPYSRGSAAVIPNAPASGVASTVAARGSTYLRAEELQHYVIADNAMLDLPNADWSISVFARADRVRAAVIQYYYNHGATGGTHNVQIYLNGTAWTAVARAGGAAVTVTNTRTQVSGEWVLVTLKRTGTDVQLDVTPQGGTTTTGTPSALSTPGVIVPAGSAYIGSRNDLNNTRFVRNCISYVFYTPVALNSTQQANLAAGQDPVSDVGLTCPVYYRLDTAAAAIANSGSGGVLPATRVNGASSKGGAIYSGSPVTIDDVHTLVWGDSLQPDAGQAYATTAITGTYLDSPSRIEVRVLGKNDVVVLDWADADSYPSAGTWSKNLRIPGGQHYTYEARHKNDTGKYCRSIRPVNVGLNVCYAGESIADQRFVSSWAQAGYAPDRDTMAIFTNAAVWATGTVFSVGNLRADGLTFQIFKCAVGHTSGAGTFAADRAANPSYWTLANKADLRVDTLNADSGVAGQFAGRYAEATGKGCVAINGGASGTKLYAGAPNNWDNYSYDLTHGRLRAVLSLFKVGAFKWIQGANDANDATLVTKTQYKSSLLNIIPRLRTYSPTFTAAQLPVGIAILGSNTSGTSVNDAAWGNIRTAIQEVLDEGAVPNLIDLGCMHDVSHTDALHPSSDITGYFRLEKRDAQAFLNKELPATYTTGMKGAVMTTATISGPNTIDVGFVLNNGTALVGITGNTNFIGFVVKNSGGVNQPISSSAFLDATTVRLTMPNNPASGWTVDYCPTQNPMGGAAIVNLLTTNASVIGDTIGVPARTAQAALTLSTSTVYGQWDFARANQSAQLLTI